MPVTNGLTSQCPTGPQVGTSLGAHLCGSHTCHTCTHVQYVTYIQYIAHTKHPVYVHSYTYEHNIRIIGLFTAISSNLPNSKF